MALTVDYPTEGRQRGDLTLRIPKRLTVRLRETRMARPSCTTSGGLFLDDTRGEVIIGTINGELGGRFGRPPPRRRDRRRQADYPARRN